jgi:outer membrane receptor for ferric coprogen and ferric-rhodotorulic acid
MTKNTHAPAMVMVLAMAALPATAADPQQQDEELEEATVTSSYTRHSANSATGLDMTLRETPQSVTVITAARIEDQNLMEISDVLNQAVGVTYDGGTPGSDAMGFYSRGFNVSNYQLDGIPRPSGMYGFGETTADMIAYDRVEIVRGATGLMNGVGSPSASVNLIRKRPTERRVGGVSAQLGSWDLYRIEADYGGPLTAGGGVRMRLAGAWQENDEYIIRAHMEKKALYGIVEADLTDHTLLSVGVEYQDFRNQDAPRGGVPLYFRDGSHADLPRSTNTSAPWSDLTNSGFSAFASLEHRFSRRWVVRINLEHAAPEYDETMGYLDRGEEFLDRATGTGMVMYDARWASHLKQDFVGAYTQGAFDWLGREHELVIGINYSKSHDNGPGYCGWWCDGYTQEVPDAYDVFTTGGGLTAPDFSSAGDRYGNSIVQSSAYAALRLKPLEPLALVLGSRVSNWKQQGWYELPGEGRTYNEANEEKHVLTPYVGVVADIGRQVSAYASFTQIFQPQSEKDIERRNLDPLEGNTYEAGLKAEFFGQRLSASAGAFRTKQDNFPVWIEGVFNPVDGGYVYEAHDGAVAKGFELELAGELIPGWQLVGGFSRAKIKDRDGAPMLTEVPVDSFKLFSSYRLRGALTGLTLGGNLRWQDKSYALAAGPAGETYRQGAVTVVDVFAKYALSRHATLQLNAENVFDKVYYRSIGWSANYATPRRIVATARWAF